MSFKFSLNKPINKEEAAVFKLPETFKPINSILYHDGDFKTLPPLTANYKGPRYAIAYVHGDKQEPYPVRLEASFNSFDNSVGWNFMALAAPDEQARKETAAFLKVLAVIGLKQRGVLVKKLMPSYEKDYLPDAKKFCERHSLNVKTFERMAHPASVLKGNATPFANGGFLKDRVVVFTKHFREAYKLLRANITDLSREQRDVLQPLLTLVNNPSSENAFKSVSKYITALGDLNLTSSFTLDEDITGGDATDLAKQRDALQKKVGGPLTVEKRQALREKDPETLRKINQTQKAIKDRFINDVRSIVAGRGKEWDFIEKVVPDLIKMGYKKETLVSRYSAQVLNTTGLIGLNVSGQLTDKNGNKTSSTGITPGVVSVVVNQDYGKPGAPAYLLKTQTQNQIDIGKQGGKSNWGKLLTDGHMNESKAKKWAIVEQALTSAALDGAKLRWRRDLLSKEPEVKLNATLLEFLYWTGARVSTTTGFTDGKATFGATTLTTNNVQVNSQNRVTVKYTGKSGVPQKHIIDVAEGTDGKEKAALKELVNFIAAKKQSADKTKAGNVFIFGNGTARIAIIDFTKYMRRIMKNTQVSPHDMRYARGTEMAEPALKGALADYKKRSKGKMDKKLAETIFTNALQPVANKLGHVSNGKPNINMTIRGYIHPKLTSGYFRELNIEPPRVVEKALGDL